jgi:hypothetical protein
MMCTVCGVENVDENETKNLERKRRRYYERLFCRRDTQQARKQTTNQSCLGPDANQGYDNMMLWVLLRMIVVLMEGRVREKT